jgi:hypothetical protein
MPNSEFSAQGSLSPMTVFPPFYLFVLSIAQILGRGGSSDGSTSFYLAPIFSGTHPLVLENAKGQSRDCHIALPDLCGNPKIGGNHAPIPSVLIVDDCSGAM